MGDIGQLGWPPIILNVAHLTQTPNFIKCNETINRYHISMSNPDFFPNHQIVWLIRILDI